MDNVDWGNTIILLGGILTWLSNWLLGDKKRGGWLIKMASVVCYTIAPLMMGLWMAVVVNGITALTQIRNWKKWGNDSVQDEKN